MAEETPILEVAKTNQKRTRATVGEQVVALLESGGGTIPEPAKQELMQVSDDAGVKAWAEMNLGNTLKAKELIATGIAGTWLMQKIEIPPMLVTYRFYTIAAAQSCIEFVNNRLKTGQADDSAGAEAGDTLPLTPEQEVSALKVKVEAVKAMGQMLDKMQKLAQDAGIIKPAESGPRNKPPNVMHVEKAVIYQNGGSQTQKPD